MNDHREVVRTYDRIAEHFAATREYAWPEVEAFLDDRDREVDVGLDVGCGNGRHSEALAQVADRVIGVDASVALLRVAGRRARDRSFTLDRVAGDASRLPLRTDCVDLALYVATIHHLPTRDARIQSIEEIARVLDPADGVSLVSTWSTAHERFDADEGFDTTIDWTLPGGETVPRYYHIYSPDEFRDDLAAAGVHVEHFELSSGNCYVTIRPEGKRP